MSLDVSSRRWRPLKPLIVAGLVLTLAVCGENGDPTQPPAENAAVAGAYELETVNGQNPPVNTYESLGTTYTITDGSVLLREDSTYVLSVLVDATSGPSRIDDPGIYRVDGNEIFGDARDGDRFDFVGTYDDGEITLTWQNDMYRFEQCPGSACILAARVP